MKTRPLGGCSEPVALSAFGGAVLGWSAGEIAALDAASAES